MNQAIELLVPKKLKEDVQEKVCSWFAGALDVVEARGAAEYFRTLTPGGQREQAFDEALHRAAKRLGTEIEPSVIRRLPASQGIASIPAIKQAVQDFFAHPYSPAVPTAGIRLSLQIQAPEVGQGKLEAVAQQFLRLLEEELVSVPEFQGTLALLSDRRREGIQSQQLEVQREILDILERQEQKRRTKPTPDGHKPSIVYWLGRPASIGKGFVGRQTELDALTEAFPIHRAVVISGGAGSGKSRLATEYTYNSGERGFWTAAGADVVQTLVALALTLDVIVEGRGDEEIAGEVQVCLAALPPDTLWVIDNLGDLGLVNALLTAAGPVRLLTATRDARRNLLPNTVAFHQLDVLEPDPAIELLCSRSNCDPSDLALPEMVEIVGRLPLALEMLAVRLGEPRQTPERLLAQLRSAPTPIELAAFQEAAGATIQGAEGVFATIIGTLAQLPEDIRERLSPLGYIADAPIPDALLAALTSLEDEGLDRLLAECSRRSVLSPSEGRVVIHALTVAAIAATNADGVLATTLDRASSRLDSINEDDPVALRAEIVHHERIHSQVRSTLVADDTSVLEFASGLAIGYSVGGRHEESIRLDEETMAARERVLGPEHLDTLASRGNLSTDYRAVGRVEEAIALDEATLPTVERVLGPEHPYTFSMRNNLANGYRIVGRYEEAITLHERNLANRERTLGPEHPDTLSSRNNLAICYRATGRHDEATSLAEQTLKLMERVLGPEHPDTLTCRSNLANGYGAVGRYDEAIRLDEETLKIRERVLGPDHPSTLTSRLNLAESYRAAGRDRDAEALESKSKAEVSQIDSSKES